MAPPATVDSVRGIHVLHHRAMLAGPPFLILRIVMTRVAATAHGASQFHPRPRRYIVWICGVIRRWSVTILALHSGKLWCLRLVRITGGQPVAHCMTGKATRVLVLSDLLESGKRLRVGRIRLQRVDALMTLPTGNCPRIDRKS